MNPHRVFVKEGELEYKREKTNDKLFPATIFLFNDCIIITTNMSTKFSKKYPILISFIFFSFNFFTIN